MTMSELRAELTREQIIGNPRFKRGYLKCRLIHMEELSFIQPDILLSDGLRREFYVPKFFDPNRIAYFEDAFVNHCKFTFATVDHGLVRVAFYQRDVVERYLDNSVMYRCFYTVLEKPLRSIGTWRRRGGSYELRLFHHTNGEV